MLRSVILAASRSGRVERLVETAPVSRGMVHRYVAGTATDDALRISRELVGQGLVVSLDHLGEDTTDPEHAEAIKHAYLDLLAALSGAGLCYRGPESRGQVPVGDSGPRPTDVSIKLSALGQSFDEKLAYQHAREICQAATNAGTTVTVDMEDHTTTDSTLELVMQLRKDFPDTGAVLQAYLRRTEADCRELAYSGSRVRLCKGAYKEPESVAFQSKLDVDRSYVRCLNILLAGEGRPMIASHDPRLIAIAEDRSKWFDRAPDSFEFQMLYGIRPREQRRLAADGYPVRVYVPYGIQWYGYLMRRLAERPANLTFFLRSLGSRG